MNLVDRVVGYFSPLAGVRRVAARRVLANYEAAEPSTLRKFRRETRTPNQDVQQSAAAIRAQVRHLVKNHDIARGALRTLVNNTVGPNGIGIEPQPRRADGTIHKEFAKALVTLYADWQRRPEVTHRHHFARVQRMMARAWIRDGEVFAQRLIGNVPLLDHGTRVPFSLEPFETEMVPMDYSDGDRIAQGIERNAWGKPVGFYVYKRSPDALYRMAGAADLKRLPFDAVYHLASLDHISQLRGVSEFASVITRLEDIKDYEESERVAAKIAAMLTAFVKKGNPDLYVPPESGETTAARKIGFQPGMIIDDLAVGEEIGLIDSKRPNPNVLTFRQGQLRAASAGIGASYSSIARDYDGSYSAQRQELVEQWIHYATLTDEFVGMFLQPVWEDFVFAATVSGVLPVPKDVVAETMNDAMYVAQAMPWIDPLKEALAGEALVKAGFASEVEMIRRRGASPQDVLEQLAAFRKEAEKLGLSFSTVVANPAAAAAVAEPEETSDDDEKSAAMKAITQRLQAAEDPYPGIIAAAMAAIGERPNNIVINQAPVNVPAAEVRIENHVAPAAAPTVEIHNEVAPTPVAISNTITVPDQPAPVVEIHNEVTVPESQNVTIVGMPDRKTTTEITRDGGGNITTSTQTETDA